MIRILLQNVILLLLPTVAYFAFIYLRRRGDDKRKGPTASDVMDGAPLIWLFAIGAALALGTMLFFASFEQGRPGQTYTPPELRDGKIVKERYN